jgi:hypothetical protein
VAVLLLTNDGAVCTPRALDDAALDQVTAGSAEAVAARAGGVVATQSGGVRQQSGTTVDLRDSAQRDARGLNVVNAAGSMTAAGLNLSAGTAAMDVGTAARQENALLQQASAPASVESWRGEAFAFESAFVSRSAASAGSVDGMVLDVLQSATGVAPRTDSEGETSIVVGSGFAAAGAIDARFGGGRVDFRFELDATFVVTGESCFLWWCSSDTGVTSGSVVLSASAEIPEVALQLTDGVACAVVLSSCAVSGSVITEATYERTGGGTAELSGAQGQTLSMGGAHVVSAGSGAVTLADGAQQSLRALNVANASRSVVGNGLNVTGGTLSGSASQLIQRNVVVQGR